jgi:hypothetical protein
MFGCPAKVGLLSEGLSLTDLREVTAEEDIEELFANPHEVEDPNNVSAHSSESEDGKLYLKYFQSRRVAKY